MMDFKVFFFNLQALQGLYSKARSLAQTHVYKESSHLLVFQACGSAHGSLGSSAD